MCGRFTSTATTDELMRRFGVTILQNLRPRWNVAPSQDSLVLVRDGLHPQPVTSQDQVFYINMALLVFVGIVCFSRLYLNAHTVSQTIAGIVLGFSLAFSLIFFQIYI